MFGKRRPNFVTCIGLNNVFNIVLMLMERHHSIAPCTCVHNYKTNQQKEKKNYVYIERKSVDNKWIEWLNKLCALLVHSSNCCSLLALFCVVVNIIVIDVIHGKGLFGYNKKQIHNTQVTIRLDSQRNLIFQIQHICCVYRMHGEEIFRQEGNNSVRQKSITATNNHRVIEWAAIYIQPKNLNNPENETRLNCPLNHFHSLFRYFFSSFLFSILLCVTIKLMAKNAWILANRFLHLRLIPNARHTQSETRESVSVRRVKCETFYSMYTLCTIKGHLENGIHLFDVVGWAQAGGRGRMKAPAHKRHL